MKPKLNKEERITHYREAMTKIAESDQSALCYALPYAHVYELWHNRRFYPEVFTIRRIARETVRQVAGRYYWFELNLDGQVKRINLLHKAIANAKRAKH